MLHKPGTVHPIGSGVQICGKTVQLVSSGNVAGQVVMTGTGGQRMVVGGQLTASVSTANNDGSVTSDAALAQFAAETGLLEGDRRVLVVVWRVQLGGGMDRYSPGWRNERHNQPSIVSKHVPRSINTSGW